MKLSELKHIVDTLSNGCAHDHEVVISVSERSIPASAFATVKCVSQGIDWNHGKLFIHPDEPLIRKPKKITPFKLKSKTP